MPGVLLCVVLRTRSSHPADMAGAADRTCGPQISAAGRTDRRHRGANKAPDGKIVREVSIGSVERPEMAVPGVWERDNFWTSKQNHHRPGGWVGFLLTDGDHGGGDGRERLRKALSQAGRRVWRAKQGGIGSVCALCARWSGCGRRYRSCMRPWRVYQLGRRPIVSPGERPFGWFPARRRMTRTERAPCLSNSSNP